MLKVLSPEEMRRADKAAIDSGVSSFRLMKAAGRAVAGAASELMGGAYGRRVTVLSGTGNNGGDGLVAAGYLARRGVAASVLMTDDPAGSKGDARSALSFYLTASGRNGVGRLSEASLGKELARSDLVIDALVGTGFKGALRGAPAQAAEMVGRSGLKVLSVDIPSGVDGSTGQTGGAAIQAVKTVTLAALKPGLLLYPGAEHAGDVEIADIGIAPEHMEASMHLAEGPDVARVLGRRSPRVHKRSVGKVLIVAGSRGMSGAAILAAAAALRAGAGLVRVAAPGSVAPLIAQAVAEVLVRPLPETSGGSIASTASEIVFDLAQQVDCVALGPGIGREEDTVKFVFDLLTGVDKPVVLDADGLNAFEGKGQDLRNRRTPTVLTPHSAELARLLGQDVKEIDGRPVESVRQAARVTGATVLLKGKPTFVAEASNVTAVNTGGPFLASAGTGDILAGVIAALAAQGGPAEAAWAGAWIHGVAGRLAAAQIERSSGGPPADRGVLASDLLHTLPAAVLHARQLAF